MSRSGSIGVCGAARRATDYPALARSRHRPSASHAARGTRPRAIRHREACTPPTKPAAKKNDDREVSLERHRPGVTRLAHTTPLGVRSVALDLGATVPTGPVLSNMPLQVYDVMLFIFSLAYLVFYTLACLLLLRGFLAGRLTAFAGQVRTSTRKATSADAKNRESEDAGAGAGAAKAKRPSMRKSGRDGSAAECRV
jgi:hypothetical protein